MTLVLERLDQIGHHRPFISLHERFDRHPRHQLDGPEPSDLVIRNLELHCICLLLTQSGQAVSRYGVSVFGDKADR
jgi:hypothetical protein